jgi:hypothetical protein
VAATRRSVHDFERTIFALFLHTIYAELPFSLMQLLQFFHVTQSDKSAQKGNDLFSKILVKRNGAHRKNGLARRCRRSFDGDRSPGDQLAGPKLGRIALVRTPNKRVRIDKLSTSRLLGRFLAASREKLREVAGRPGVRRLANLVEVRPDDAILNYGSHRARGEPPPRGERGQVSSIARLVHFFARSGLRILQLRIVYRI